MASGTPSLAIEDHLAAGWITRHCSSFGLSLKDAEIFDEGTNCRSIEAAERRHAVGRNSVRDDLCEPRVCAVLSFLGRCDVGSTFTSSSVESMTSGTAVFKRLASFRNRALILRWVLLRGRCTFDVESEREKSASKRDDCESFDSEPSTRMIRASIREPSGRWSKVIRW